MCPGGVSAWEAVSGGCVSRVCVCPGCVCVRGVCVQGGAGGCLPSWVAAPVHAGIPPLDRMTDACENFTLPQLCCGR